jgi:Integrase zinc binding domain
LAQNDKTFIIHYRFGHPEHKHFRKQAFSVAEKKATEMLLWQTSQQNGFAEDFQKLAQGKDLNKASKLTQHNPSWDHIKRLVASNSQLVQSNLQVEKKWPILLPKNCPIVAKYVLHLHEMSGHQGAGYMLSILRQQFCLCQGRQQVQKIIRTCTKRHCTKPVPLQQQMAPLPALLTDNLGAFRHCSTDLFGPMLEKHSCAHTKCPHPKNSKVHGALLPVSTAERST